MVVHITDGHAQQTRDQALKTQTGCFPFHCDQQIFVIAAELRPQRVRDRCFIGEELIQRPDRRYGALRDRTHGRGFISFIRDHGGGGVKQLGYSPLPSLLPGDAPGFIPRT